MHGSFPSGASGRSTSMPWSNTWTGWRRCPPGKERNVMNSREEYAPGAASGAKVEKDGDKWTLVLVRDLSHPPANVWKALTEPEQLREWAPFDSDENLGTVGAAKLTTV